MAFHVVNAWEETVEVEGQDGGPATTNAVVKVATCDMFEFNLDLTAYMTEPSAGELAPTVTCAGDYRLNLLLGCTPCGSQRAPSFPCTAEVYSAPYLWFVA